MKKFIYLASLAVMLLFGGVAQANAAMLPTAIQSVSSGDFAWVHFGADRAYETREAAMADRAHVFKNKFGYSDSQVACLVAATAKKGTTVLLNVGDRFRHMLSGHGVVHPHTVIAFQDAQRGIQFTARAEEWVVDCDGTTITVDLPEVCNNWSDREPRKPDCVALMFNAVPGTEVRWGVGSVDGPLPPSACNAQQEGNHPRVAWYGQCDVCAVAVDYLYGVMGDLMQVWHKYLYRSTETRQTLWFSTSIWTKGVYICLHRPDGTGGMAYMRPVDWRSRYQVEIYDSTFAYGPDGIGTVQK